MLLNTDDSLVSLVWTGPEFQLKRSSRSRGANLRFLPGAACVGMLPTTAGEQPESSLRKEGAGCRGPGKLSVPVAQIIFYHGVSSVPERQSSWAQETTAITLREGGPCGRWQPGWALQRGALWGGHKLQLLPRLKLAGVAASLQRRCAEGLSEARSTSWGPKGEASSTCRASRSQAEPNSVTKEKRKSQSSSSTI